MHASAREGARSTVITSSGAAALLVGAVLHAGGATGACIHVNISPTLWPAAG